MNTQDYFKMIEKKTKEVYAVAEEARKKNLDPVSKVEIPLAKSLAEKVVGLISISTTKNILLTESSRIRTCFFKLT